MTFATAELTQLPGPGVQTAPQQLKDWDQKVRQPRVTKLTKKRVSVIIIGPSATPAKVLLGSLNHPRLYLKAPIELKVSRDDGFVVVSNDELDEFGYGDFLTLAIEDFRQTLLELYYEL